MLSGGEESPSDTYRARALAEGEEERKMGMFAYGGAYAGNPNPFGTVSYAPPPGRWVLNPQTNRVEEVPV